MFHIVSPWKHRPQNHTKNIGFLQKPRRSATHTTDASDARHLWDAHLRKTMDRWQHLRTAGVSPAVAWRCSGSISGHLREHPPLKTPGRDILPAPSKGSPMEAPTPPRDLQPGHPLEGPDMYCVYCVLFFKPPCEPSRNRRPGTGLEKNIG